MDIIACRNHTLAHSDQESLTFTQLFNAIYRHYSGKILGFVRGLEVIDLSKALQF